MYREVSKERRSRMAPPTVRSSAASAGIRKGAWSKEEDSLLRKCVQTYGEGNWHLVPQRAGLKRCRKSCRLRWLNYLSPDIKRGRFSSDEEDLIMRMHWLLGNKWSLIAGRIPGRTANGVKNHWNSHLAKRASFKPAERKVLLTPPRIVVHKPEAQKVSIRMYELPRHMYSPRDQQSLNPPSSSLPLDGARMGDQFLPPKPADQVLATEPSNSNLQWLPEKYHDLEEFAPTGDCFLDIPEPDDLFWDSLFLWDWSEEDNGSLPPLRLNSF